MIEQMQLTTVQLCRCADLLLVDAQQGRHRDKLNAALQAYRQALVVDPNNLYALTECGKLLVAYGDEGQGKEMQDRALSLMAWALGDVMPDSRPSESEAIEVLTCSYLSRTKSLEGLRKRCPKTLLVCHLLYRAPNT